MYNVSLPGKQQEDKYRRPTALEMYTDLYQCSLFHNIRELRQQDGWKTQDGRMTKKCRAKLYLPNSYATFFRHSAVLSRPTILLRKHGDPIIPNRS